PAGQLAADDEVALTYPEFPVLVQPAGGDQAIVSSNGHLKDVRSHPGLEAMLRQINSGQRTSVKALESLHGPGAGEMLSFLVATRALEVVSRR
ncbi:MAG TPA: hypothetical protein VFB81_08655, partial [Myxococcales bacterium]|nr:hypothetical protein [Myxococcales bacterium]